MKIQITYTETQITTYTKEVEVTKKQLKELQKRGAFYDTLTEELEQEAADHGEVLVDSKQLQINF